jgi:hypothetical protein
MSLKNLSDDQLRAFIENPRTFLESDTNYDAVFDLSDRELAAKVKLIEESLDLPEYSLRERMEDAK